MKHCYITSIPMLRLVENDEQHLVLPHLFDSLRYVEFCATQVAKGYRVIQDNAAYEIAFTQLGERYDLTDEGTWDSFLMRGPRQRWVNVVVTPEAFGDGLKSCEMTREFLDKYKAELQVLNVRTMAVCQGGNWDDFLTSYQFLSAQAQDDVDMIGIPFDLPFTANDQPLEKGQYGRQQGLSRLSLIRRLIDHGVWCKKKDHHLFGLHNPAELAAYRDIPNIKSSDSSCCFVQSLYGAKLHPQQGLVYKKIDDHHFLRAGFTCQEQFRCWDHNRRVIRDFATGREERRAAVLHRAVEESAWDMK